jgi:hypothetical protein
MPLLRSAYLRIYINGRNLYGCLQVVNVYDATSWCSLQDVDCFVLPWWSGNGTGSDGPGLNGCPPEQRLVGDPAHPNIEGGGYWGCAYDPETDKGTQNLVNPPLKDTFQIWQRSWAVLRFEATKPGYWYFHCHETQHSMLGLQTVFNVLPSMQPPVPDDVPSSGWCRTQNQRASG